MSSPRGLEEARICDMTVGCRELRRVAAAGGLGIEGEDTGGDGSAAIDAEAEVELVFSVVLELKELLSGGMMMLNEGLGQRWR